MIKLSSANIAAEIFAVTALRYTVAPQEVRPAVLDRDNLPALRVVIRQAFSDMVERLTPFIIDAKMEEIAANSPLPYSVEDSLSLELDFGEYTINSTAGMLMVLRHRLEHLAALLTLARIYANTPFDNPAEEEARIVIDQIATTFVLDYQFAKIRISGYH